MNCECVSRTKGLEVPPNKSREIEREVNRRIARIRHKHEAAKVAGLAERMQSDGQDGLEVDRVFKDLGQLRAFQHLKYLSVRRLKKGIAAIAELPELLCLRLWELRDLNADWLAHLPHLRHLEVYGVGLRSVKFPAESSQLRILELTDTRGLGPRFDLSPLTRLECLCLEGCHDIEELRGLKALPRLTHVTLSNLRALKDTRPLQDAPHLQSVIVQGTPALSPSNLAWMLDHPTLSEAYPALAPYVGDPVLDEVASLLEPRFGKGFLDTMELSPYQVPRRYWQL